MPRRVRVNRRAEPTGTNTPTIVVRALDTIFPYEGNPRDNEAAVDSVARSIEDFGFLVPVVVDDHGVIVAGHTRYRAALKLGLETAPCIIASHLNEEQIRAFRVIDNKVAELAQWDTDLLSAELTALANSGINFTEFGWTQEEIDCLTEIVADDCMSAGAAASLDRETVSARAGQRAPDRTRLVIGEFVIFIPSTVYRRWAAEVRAECDYVESRIEYLLKERLGILPYEEAQ